MLRSPAVLAILLFSASLAHAWDPLGHMLVCQIAYDHLTPEAKTRIEAALARFNAEDKPDAPYTFVTAGCWMDDIRSRTQPEFKQYAPWHYVNLPFTAEGLPLPDASAGANVITGVQKCEDVLAGRVNDPSMDKDQALVMLLHLVGDIHQPLHATSRGDDMGGNKVKIGNLKDPLVDLIFSKGGNLHFYWDSAYRRVFQSGYATVSFEAPLYDRATPAAGHLDAVALVREQAAAIEKKFPPASFKNQGDAAAWALESHAIGFSLAYGQLPKSTGADGVKLAEAYVKASREVAEQRIAFAGYRLAALLNGSYGQPAASPTPAPATGQ